MVCRSAATAGVVPLRSAAAADLDPSAPLSAPDLRQLVDRLHSRSHLIKSRVRSCLLSNLPAFFVAFSAAAVSFAASEEVASDVDALLRLLAPGGTGGRHHTMAAAVRMLVAGGLHARPFAVAAGGVLLRRGGGGWCPPAGSKRRLCCRALYRTEVVKVQEDGQPETLDYRVFFVDGTGKKVLGVRDHIGFFILDRHFLQSYLRDGKSEHCTRCISANSKHPNGLSE